MFLVDPHSSALAILPICGIPSGLTKVNDCCYLRIGSRRQRSIWWDKIIVGEDIRHVAVDFNSAGILELANGIRNLKWPSEIWMELEERLC